MKDVEIRGKSKVVERRCTGGHVACWAPGPSGCRPGLDDIQRDGGPTQDGGLDDVPADRSGW
jgi:hypothetical protein